MTARSAAPSSPRLHGRWLAFARTAWLVVALLAVGIFVVGDRLRFAELQEVCTASVSVCTHWSLLRPENVRELHALGLSPEFWALYNGAMSIVFAAVWWAVGAVIFVRRSDDRMALLVSLFLVTFTIAFWPDIPGALARYYPAFGVPVGVLRILGDVLAMLFFYLFPSGRFVPRWTRWLAVVWFAQRIEQRCDNEGRGDYGQLRLAACEGAEGVMQGDHAAEVDQGKRGRKRSVDESTVYENVYVEEARAQDGDAYT